MLVLGVVWNAKETTHLFECLDGIGSMPLSRNINSKKTWTAQKGPMGESWWRYISGFL